MTIFKVILVGTTGVGKKSLAAALLRHMGEGGPSDVEDESGVLSATPKQAANINNQTCRIECDDVFVEDDDDDAQESSALIPKESARPGKRPLLKRGPQKTGGPKLRKKENVFDKAKMQRGLAKAKLVGKMATAAADSEEDQFPTGYIIVFDIGDVKSFREAENQMDKLCAPPVHEDQQVKHVVLAGNKTDKSRRYRRVTYEEGLKLSQKYPDVPYFETSAKLYQKVDKVFLTVVKKVQTAEPVNIDVQSNPVSETGGGIPGQSQDRSSDDATDKNAAIKGAPDDSDIDESNLFHKTCCCKCCPKSFRKCGRKVGKRCTIM